MRAEFYREGAPDHVVGSAGWDGRSVQLAADDSDVQASLRRIFRPSPVAVDDPGVRPPATRGDVVFHPGSLQWFRAAALQRAAAEGLQARLVSASTGAGGWDPAATYRPFAEQIRRLQTP